jgi:hypothetical protein
MFKDRHILKKILVFDIAIVAYILLTSSIIQYRSERKVAEVVVSSIVEWSKKNFEAHDKVVEREKELSRTADPELVKRLFGSVLIQVESYGEAWYLNPADGSRYYLGKARDAHLVIRRFARTIDDQDLFNYIYFDQAFPAELAGSFVYGTEKPDDYYYIAPQDRRGHLLQYPEESFRTLTGLGIGIKNEDIRKIPVGELPK